MAESSNMPNYVIITPARNEEKNIGRLIACITKQTIPPQKWIIVNDNSTDNTAEIVESNLHVFPWIELIDFHNHRNRNFASKVYCFNVGFERVRELGFEIIGNVDADISFMDDYFEFLLRKFMEDPNLGVAGTPFVEGSGYSSVYDSFEGERHVAGGCQLFRRKCFEEIGGYQAIHKGGIDWIAVTTARMKGWKTRSFYEKTFHHHRRLGTGETSAIGAYFNYGRKDYYLGNHPVWEMLRIGYRLAKKPYAIAGLALLLGYLWEAVYGEGHLVSKELVRFHRTEEMQKLKTILLGITRNKRPTSIDSTRSEKERI